MSRLNKLISTGNSKVPYYIFNMTSATDCPSRKLGICKVADICYAIKAEKLYKQVLPYRNRQAEYWKSVPAVDFVNELIAIQSRSRTMPKVLRFSESGDFASQSDVDKMTDIAETLKLSGWLVYGYTARVDLDLSRLLKSANVNLSNDSSESTKQGANRFKVVDSPSGDNSVCVGDCTKCKLCLNKRGKIIEVIKH